MAGTQLVQGQGLQGVCLAAAAVPLLSFGAAALKGLVQGAETEAELCSRMPGDLGSSCTGVHGMS
jgi:hypothetical protein